MTKGIGGHQSHRAETTTWLTPPEIIRALGTFDLDPCAAPDQPWPTARQHWSLPMDGLRPPWNGRVWLNPPYGRAVGDWLQKLADHGCGTALVFARTETSWFFPLVFTRAAAVFFFSGRLHFHYPDGARAKSNAGAPSCLVAYGADDAAKLKASGLPGKFIDLGENDDPFD